MMIVVTTLHVLACIVLVLSVLLQAGKGADMGAVFGGASTTIFGGSGAGNFLTRITTAAAVVFMFTSLTLTYGPRGAGTATVMPETAAVPGAAAPIPPIEEAGAPPLDAAPAPVAAAPEDAAPVDTAPAGDAPAAEAPAAEAPAAEAPAAEAPADDAAAEPPAVDGGGGSPPAVP